MNNISKRVLVAIGAIVLCWPLSGCGDENQQAEPKEKEAARAAKGAEMRTYFDKSNGNYDALSQEDKDAINKITGSEANTKKAFGYMVPNRGAGGTGGGLPPSGPGGPPNR
ncbi:MAG: hypothetical protein JSS65_01395 [Armatimonadetes bacterium]|nr:hypothetical protein [Armatimonadota bacterium]